MANPAINIAVLAAAASQQKALDSITGRLQSADATGPTKAASLDPLTAGEARALAQLRKQGLVRSTGAGRFYLDEDRKRELAARNRTFLMIAAAVLASTTASLLAVLLSR